MIKPRQVGDVSNDAVIIVPGIMGSTLVDAQGRQWWGAADPGWYAASLSHDGLDALRLRPEERDGHAVRLRPGALVRSPVFLPGLGGVEPYTLLIERVRQAVVHPQAVLEFAYDWRLPVLHNARLLAVAAIEHLQAWRRSDVHRESLRMRPDRREARLVLVAHSTGGLLARALTLIPGVTEHIRGLITFGTPLRGAPLAAVLLGSGEDAPVPPSFGKVGRLAATLPGVHDLLPSYRCVYTGADVRMLTPGDVASLGGDAALARDAARLHALLEVDHASDEECAPYGGRSAVRRRQERLDEVTWTVLGVGQPTVQSLGLRDGRLEQYPFTFRFHPDGEPDRDPATGLPVRVYTTGDGVVPRASAERPGARPLTHRHAALVRYAEAVDLACEMIIDGEVDSEGPLRPGDPRIGIDAPQVVLPGQPWTFTVTGIDDPGRVTCSVRDTASGWRHYAPLGRRDGRLCAEVTLPRPGLYRIVADRSRAAPVTCLLLAADPGAAGGRLARPY